MLSFISISLSNLIFLFKFSVKFFLWNSFSAHFFKNVFGAFTLIFFTNFPLNIRLDGDVLKTPCKHLSCLSSEDVFKTSWSRPIHSSWPYVFKTSSRRFQDVFKTSCKNVFKTSSRRLQDVLQRYLQDVFKTYHQVKLFLLTSLRDVFNKFLRYTAKTVIYRRICLGHTCEKFMVIVQNLQKW